MRRVWNGNMHGDFLSFFWEIEINGLQLLSVPSVQPWICSNDPYGHLKSKRWNAKLPCFQFRHYSSSGAHQRWRRCNWTTDDCWVESVQWTDVSYENRVESSQLERIDSVRNEETSNNFTRFYLWGVTKVSFRFDHALTVLNSSATMNIRNVRLAVQQPKVW